VVKSKSSKVSKLVIVVLMVCLVATSIIGVTNYNVEAASHMHKYKVTKTKKSTCKAKGYQIKKMY